MSQIPEDILNNLATVAPCLYLCDHNTYGVFQTTPLYTTLLAISDDDITQLPNIEGESYDTLFGTSKLRDGVTNDAILRIMIKHDAVYCFEYFYKKCAMLISNQTLSTAISLNGTAIIRYLYLVGRIPPPHNWNIIDSNISTQVLCIDL